MADMEEVKNTNPATFHGQLEVDSVVPKRGCGYYDENAPEDGSRISHPQPLTGHPPQQNGIDGTGEHRLVSNIERDGRLESRDRFEDFIQARRRATEEMDKVYRLCEGLYAENERLRREGAICKDCRGILDESMTEKDKIIEDQKRLIEKLTCKIRCERLIDEVAQFRRNDQLCEEVEGDQIPLSIAGDGQKGLAFPKQTESIGNALESVDPYALGVKERKAEIVEGSLNPGGEPVQTAAEERPRTPSIEECAIFLGDRIHEYVTEPFKLLIEMGLSLVTIQDLQECHLQNCYPDQQEFWIDGIKTGLISAKGDRIAFLLDALRKSNLMILLDEFCDEFNIQYPLEGNALESVDPVALAVKERQVESLEGSLNPGGEPGQTAVEERPRIPSPEECAIFLADILNLRDAKTLLRKMSLSRVTLEDLEVRHPRAPKEYRIDGIKTGIISAKGDRIAFLLDALKKSHLILALDQFCSQFNFNSL